MADELGSPPPLRLVLADDQPLLRMGFRMVLDAQADMTVVGEAADGAQAVRLVRELAPDLVLMDVRMPVLDGIAATRQITDSHPDTRVLVLTTFDLDELAFSALRAGAGGFLLKDVGPDDLLAGIRTVSAGNAVVSPRITRRLVEELVERLPVGQDGAPDPRVAALTPREHEVLLEIAAGLSNAEIGQRLFLSEGTVKTHVGRVLGKLGLRDRVQAVVFAYEHRLI